ncbi:MAG TPA: hypothetical protein PKD64_01860 [Pirellulaceae bacterium]|nr:hypothetical protein [Pirellulaceae bacterium]HMO90916.1 hypothetical protein [Pirellulaceae bacterium]HMP68608.1 hypothetical protein [Pirellulaceae bacterium]
MTESRKDPQHNSSPIHRYFAGLTEATFQAQLGVADSAMVDYVSDLLVRFVRSDVVHRIRGVNGRPLMSITEMTVEATKRMGDARRELHRHIGDFTLFWAGVFPEALRHGCTERDDQFESYCSYGKLSYRLAGSIEPADETAPESEILLRLSERFELCAYGLREIRREWEEGGDRDFGGMILLN